MVGGLAVHKQIQRVIFVVIAAMICAALAIPLQARAETPLAAFCADNAAELQRTSGEMGLVPPDECAARMRITVDEVHRLVKTGALRATGGFGALLVRPALFV